MVPIYDQSTLERMGFNRVINDAQVLKKVFDDVPSCYKNQLNSILEDYDIVTASKKN